ncbi:type VI secretion system tip protein VgrG [Oxalobacteraceae bacterium]|nr:type VI secretion system tip protein VgrG [Oxalobacteraceae bacterium]
MNDFRAALMTLASLISDPQGQRLLRLDFPRNDGPQSMMLANTIDAEESISRDFSYTVEVLSDDAHIPLTDVMGKMVTISLVRDDGSLRYFNGYVFEFRFVRTDGGFAFYQMVLKPWLAYLRLGKNSHAFHDLLLTEICEETFVNYPQRDYQYRLSKDAPMLTLAVQHNESDHNHLYRRLEAAGYHTWYEHRYDGHTLWIGDDSTLADAIDGREEMEFQSQAGAREDDGIAQWSPTRRIQPQKVTVNSYNFKIAGTERPDQLSMNRQGAVLATEVYEDTAVYGFKDFDDGERLARRRMEAIDAQGQDFRASSNDRLAQPRRWFRLAGHFSVESLQDGYDSVMGADAEEKEYLILSVRHRASNNYQDGQGTPSEYSNEFSCLRRTIPWRPVQGFNSADTRIYGVQTATVVGPEGEEIHTDQYGRVRLQFHWDREGKFDAGSSPWVRVASAFAGANFGQIYVPRVRQEVVVMFIDGNCDRPLVVGGLYNVDNMPPWTLPDNKTQSGVLTRSSRGGTSDNANALRFEDRKGEEEVWLHAEKDQRIEVEHDESHTVGNDRRQVVGRDETVEVKHDRKETVGNDENIAVLGSRTERIGVDESVDVGVNRTATIGQTDITTVGGLKLEITGLAKEEVVGAAKSLNIGGMYGITVGETMTTDVAQSQVDTVAGNKSAQVGLRFAVTAGSSIELSTGSASITMSSDGTISISGTNISIGASGPVRINGKDVDVN